MRTVEFLNFLDEANRLRVTFQVEQGTVEGFVVQYEGQFGGQWHAVARYDTAHGFAHQDLLRPDGTNEKRELDVQQYNSALQVAMDDLRLNWTHYRERYETWTSRP